MSNIPGISARSIVDVCRCRVVGSIRDVVTAFGGPPFSKISEALAGRLDSAPPETFLLALAANSAPGLTERNRTASENLDAEALGSKCRILFMVERGVQRWSCNSAVQIESWGKGRAEIVVLGGKHF